MLGKRMAGFWGACLAILVIVETGQCEQGVGKALDEAFKSRATGTVEEVTQQFQKAAEQTGNPGQKASILSLLAEFLMEKQEWGKAIETYERILVEGTPADKAGAYYGAAQAHLMMGQPGKAEAICAELKANCPNNTLESFANYMKGISPNSVHAKLAEFLVKGTPATIEKPQESTGAVKAEMPKPNEESRTETPASEMPTPTKTEEAKQPISDEREKAEIKKNRMAVGIRGWNSDLLGHIGAKGMSLDLSKGTDIGKQSKLSIYGSWKFSEKDQLRLDHSLFDHSGNLTQGVTFDKLLYTPGASVKVKTSFFDVGLSRLLDNSENGSWKLLYGVKFSRSFMRLAQQLAAGTRAGELNQMFNVPYLGVGGSANLSGNVTLNGSLKYFSLNRSGASGRLTDFDVALLFGHDYAKEPAGTEWYGTLGYRFFLFHGEADNDSAKSRYSGPTFGFESRF